jgi:hypothetical protein
LAAVCGIEKYGYDFETALREVESYLKYNGLESTGASMPTVCLYVTKAMDYFDLTTTQPVTVAPPPSRRRRPGISGRHQLYPATGSIPDYHGEHRLVGQPRTGRSGM